MNRGITVSRESDNTYKLTLPNGQIKTGLTLKEAANMAEKALAEIWKAEENHENDNHNHN